MSIRSSTGDVALLAELVGDALLGHDLHRHFPLAVGERLRRRRDRAVVVDDDLLEQVVDQVLQLGRRHLADALHQLRAARVGRALEGMGVAEGADRLVELVLADVVLQGVEDEAALVVVDVGWSSTRDSGSSFFCSKARPREVAVQLVGEEAAHLGGAELLLHHHQRRVLRQRLDQHRAALHVAAHHLVPPPLVRRLVRRDVVRIVDVLGIVGPDPGDEADRLRVRNRVRERLGEGLVARELDDPELPVLVRPERGAEVGERVLDREVHRVEVELVPGLVVDLDRHRARRTRPGVLLHRVARRLEGEEVQRSAHPSCSGSSAGRSSVHSRCR